MRWIHPNSYTCMLRPAYHGGHRLGCTLAVTLLFCLFAAALAPAARAEPVLSVVRGTEPDGSDLLTEDLAILWRASAAYDPGALAVVQLTNPHNRLRALRTGRAAFAIVDAGAYAGLQADFPDVVVLSALFPLTVHALMRSPDPGPLRNVPATVATTAGARFAAEALARAKAPDAATVLRGVDPPAALDLVKQGPPGTLVLIGAPLGTQDLAVLLRDNPAVRLLSLAPPLMDAVRRDRPWVLTTQVLRGTYPNQAEAADSPSVPLLMLSMPTLSLDDARRMLDCLYGRRDQVSGFDPLFGAIDRRANSDLAKWAPFHAAAVKEFGLTP